MTNPNSSLFVSKQKSSIFDQSKWMILFVLMLVGLTNYMDRLSITILQVPIKADLGLSDTQLGAVTGLSFSLVYTLAAIPIARLADRISPKLVMLICLIVWNGLTMLCGLANGFLALAILRMGVAIGEAGCGPAAQSLLARHFPTHQRGRAIAIWQMVFPLGTLVGIYASGMLSASMGWRSAFMLLGGLGLLVVPMVYFFLPRDRDQPRVSVKVPAPDSTTIREALREVLKSQSYRLILAAGFLAAIPLSASLNWNAPFYSRSFSLTMEETTLIVALIAGIGGALGMIGGGFLSDFLGRRDSRWYCWIPAIAVLLMPITAFWQYRMAPTPLLAFPAGMLGAILLNSWLPPQAAIAQSLVRPANRALTAACILVTAGMGNAVGPFATGLLSDFLLMTGIASADALAWSVALISLTALPAALLFYMASANLRADLAAHEANTPPAPAPDYANKD